MPPTILTEGSVVQSLGQKERKHGPGSGVAVYGVYRAWLRANQIKIWNEVLGFTFWSLN